VDAVIYIVSTIINIYSVLTIYVLIGCRAKSCRGTTGWRALFRWRAMTTDRWQRQQACRLLLCNSNCFCKTLLLSLSM
jgi:hypothetical protein